MSEKDPKQESAYRRGGRGDWRKAPTLKSSQDATQSVVAADTLKKETSHFEGRLTAFDGFYCIRSPYNTIDRIHLSILQTEDLHDSLHESSDWGIFKAEHLPWVKNVVVLSGQTCLNLCMAVIAFSAITALFLP